MRPAEQIRRHMEVLTSRVRLENNEAFGLLSGRWDVGVGRLAFPRKAAWHTVEELISFCERARNRLDTYVNMGILRCPLGGTTGLDCGCQANRFGASHISRMIACFVELDVKDSSVYASSGAIREKVASFAIPPTYTVASGGGGVHVAWVLAEPTRDFERFRGVQRALVTEFQCDHVIDTARVLRLSGTRNFKYGEPRPVRLLSSSRSTTTLDSLEAVVGRLDDSPVRRSAARQRAGHLVIRGDAEPPTGSLYFLRGRSTTFAQTWDRCRDLSWSQSEYDLSIAAQTLDAGWSDQEVVDALVAHRRSNPDASRRSPKRAGYYQATIAKARHRISA